MISSVTSATIEPAALGQFANSAKGPSSVGQDKITQVASDFESLFASQMLKEMRKTLDPETMFGGDSGDVYGGMFDQFVGQQMARSGGFGLARMLRETLQKEQLATRRDPTHQVTLAPMNGVTPSNGAQSDE